MLEFDKGEVLRSSWKRDAVVIVAWSLCLALISSLNLPSFLNMTGVAFVLIYAAWSWGPMKAAALFLLLAFIFAQFSMMPAGLFWLSVYLVYVVLKLAQGHFILVHAHQFAFAVAFSSLAVNLIQMICLSQMIDAPILSWLLLMSLLSVALMQGVLAWIGFYPIQSLMLIR